MSHGNGMNGKEKERDVLVSYSLAASTELIHRRKERQESNFKRRQFHKIY